VRARLTVWVAGVGALLAGSCGGRGAAPADSFSDGSRLKGIWEQALGAPRRWVGWYDTALDTPCTFQYPAAPYRSHLPGDVQYCVPTSSTFSSFDDNYFFADAGCTQPVTTGASCDGRFATWHPLNYDVNDCAQASRIFRTGATVALTPAYYRNEMGACVQLDAPSPGTTWFEVGDEVPLATLVGATIEIPTGDGARIRALTLRAQDGAYAQVGAWDALRQEPVEIAGWFYNDPPADRWDPISVAGESLGYYAVFSDDNCKQRAAVSETCGGVRVASIAQMNDQRQLCESRIFRHYEISARLDPSTVRAYDPAFNTCSSPTDYPAADDISFFAPGAEIDDDTLAGARVIEEGNGRIHMRLPGSADGPIDMGTGLTFDSQLGQRCNVRAAADGSLRCLPNADYFPNYGDPACTTPAIIHSFGGCGPTEPPSVVNVMQPQTSACAVQTYRSYPLVGPHAGAVYSLNAGFCQPVTGLVGRVAFYDLGPELPPETFAPIATSEHYPAW